MYKSDNGEELRGGVVRVSTAVYTASPGIGEGGGGVREHASA